MLYRGRDKKEFYLASLLYDSIEFRHIESVTSLLTKKGADPNLVLPKKGICAFHLAIGCESYEFALKVTTIILQHGGNPNVRSDDGLTPVHIAAAWGRMEILRLLLSNGGDAEARDVARKTPFHYATEEGFDECLSLLKEYCPANIDLIASNVEDENEEDVGCFVLDKIRVDDGTIVGEYALDNPPDSITCAQHLQSLPRTDATEYILNWFSSQQSSTLNSTGAVANSSLEPAESSLAESDCDRESKRCDSKYITFRKVYRRTRSKSSSSPQKVSPLDTTAYLDVQNESGIEFSCAKEYSKESGVVTLSLHNSQMEVTPALTLAKQEKSSDYLTCSQNSINSLLEKNVFDITEDLSLLDLQTKKDINSESPECSFVSVSEVYKYVDNEEGVVLYERRLLKTSVSSEAAKTVSNTSSNDPSLPQTFDYDTDTLRKELTLLGYNPGPITITTKKVYLKKLHQLKKYPAVIRDGASNVPKRVYSLELERTLHSTDWCNNIAAFKELEAILTRQFDNPDRSRKWREGVNKSSFTYLLLDPRVTNNLPLRADTMEPLQTWRTFLSAIFYVGKGKRSRPYQHLYDAVDLWKRGRTSESTKLRKIMDIWQSECGVICLHVFLNIIPVEAYTREAAMISALKLENLTNAKSGEYYGLPATWPQKQKRMLGVYLLHKAMMIFLHEGERQLCPTDIG